MSLTIGLTPQETGFSVSFYEDDILPFVQEFPNIRRNNLAYLKNGKLPLTLIYGVIIQYNFNNYYCAVESTFLNIVSFLVIFCSRKIKVNNFFL